MEQEFSVHGKIHLRYCHFDVVLSGNRHLFCSSPGVIRSTSHIALGEHCTRRAYFALKRICISYVFCMENYLSLLQRYKKSTKNWPMTTVNYLLQYYNNF